MNYRETVDFLYSQLPMFHRVGMAAYKANLDNTHYLDRFFGHPHKKFRTIHIAGTNGKGSVSSMLASVLTESGYKTGLYTSPHLVDYRERVRINGVMIPENDVVDFVEKCRNIIEEIKPSFFELTTALAFWYFAKEKVDVAIIETGMGGRLDCTNIITPELSVITNIAFDHTEFLGDTLAKIAAEKAGIIKNKIPVVIGERHTETEIVFSEKAGECDSDIVFAEDFVKCEYVPSPFRHSELDSESPHNYNLYSLNLTLSCPLTGNYQTKNIATAFASLEILKQKFSISEDAIINGFKNVKENSGIRGRWEMLQQNPLVVCDTGHNPHGIKEVVKNIEACKYNKLFMVIGMVNDKDINSVLALLPRDAYYIFTQASVPRALDAHELFTRAQGQSEVHEDCAGDKSVILREPQDDTPAPLVILRHSKDERVGLKGEVILNVKEAYKKALSLAGSEDMVFVGGSTFVVADLLKSI